MNCKSRECGKPFKRETNRQKYCSNKCQAREAYLVSKEAGWRSGVEKEYRVAICNYRKCKKEFRTTHNQKMYCCSNCAKYERKLVKVEEGKARYIPRVDAKEIVCGSRRCQNVFKATAYNSKYCSDKCCSSENSARTYDRKYANKQPKRSNTLHRKILATSKKVTEYVNPKMSAKWLQDLWDKRKERECA